MGLAALVGVTWPHLSWQYAAWPFLISALVLGMPHGAIDFKLLVDQWQPARRGLLVTILYLALIAAFGVLLWFLPRLTLILFGLVTVVHFGLADARDPLRMLGRAMLSGPALWATALGRGGFVLSVPFAWDPAAAWEPVTMALTLLQTPEPAAGLATIRLGGMLATGLSLALLAVGLGLTFQAEAAASAEEAGGWIDEPLLILHLSELGILAAGAAVLSPLFFIGLYFIAWHAIRHFRQAGTLTGYGVESPWPLLLKLNLWSLPFLLPTLAVYGWIGREALSKDNATGWVVLLLLFFAVLTPAHHLLIECALWQRGGRINTD
jgi:Brp/Blh family beta-carotene 15,15'-monooxygenase